MEILVSDRGSSPLTSTCVLNIILFDVEETATVLIKGEFLNRDIFLQVLGETLNLDIDITSDEVINSTFYEVDILGRDGINLISADNLTLRIDSLSEIEKELLRQAGITIVTVRSNTPTSSPTSAVPTRFIPIEAVVAIVVVNSVIVIVILLIVLVIVWRRYNR